MLKFMVCACLSPLLCPFRRLGLYNVFTSYSRSCLVEHISALESWFYECLDFYFISQIHKCRDAFFSFQQVFHLFSLFHMLHFICRKWSGVKLFEPTLLENVAILVQFVQRVQGCISNLYGNGIWVSFIY